MVSVGVGEAYLAHHARFRPVDASFMALQGHDDRLPDASATAAADERNGIASLQAMLEALPEAVDPGERLDRRIAGSQLAATGSALQSLPRFSNPAWYTGEAAFGVISLLLPGARPTPHAALLARLKAIPDFLADARARLAGGAAARRITERARMEAAATAAFLRSGVRLHEEWQEEWNVHAEVAASAFDAFATAIDALPDASGAVGRAHVELLMREVHGLDFDAGEATRRAAAAFDDLTRQLEELAARRDPGASWRVQLAQLDRPSVAAPAAVLDLVRGIDRDARAGAAALVTPANEYGLEYRWLAPCWREVAKSLYFLSYRSPPACCAGTGSTYWITPFSAGDAATYLAANAETPVKVTHAVHHGSIGHHTQNARARVAASRLARVGGTDCALGLAFLCSGTMVEGWACYAQDLMQEVPGFYSQLQGMYLLQQQRRNVASVLVDIRLHTGEWTPDEAEAFYRDQAYFAAARVGREITRNLMLPGTRLMYWLGTQAILDLRRRWRGGTREFHDTLLGYGHVPVAWAGEEMARAGLLA